MAVKPRLVTETIVNYVTVQPDGKIWQSSQDFEKLLEMSKFWAGPGDLSFERLTTVIHREPVIRQTITNNAIRNFRAKLKGGDKTVPYARKPKTRMSGDYVA